MLILIAVAVAVIIYPHNVYELNSLFSFHTRAYKKYKNYKSELSSSCCCVWQIVILFISGKWPESTWSYPLKLKDKGITVYVVTTDPAADTPEALRAASEEKYVFRTNLFSDVEEAEPKVTHAATKGNCLHLIGALDLKSH